MSRYQKDGNQTLLVLEPQDIALVNRAMIYQAAFSQVQHHDIDQGRIAQTYEPEVNPLFIYCLLADRVDGSD